MQNDAYNFLNIIISALLLTLPYLAPKSTSMHSICPHLKCIWNSRTEVGVEEPDRAELQFPGDMFSKHPKISLRVKCSTWWLRVSAAHTVHSAPVLLTGMVTWLPVMIFHAVEFFFLVPLPCWRNFFETMHRTLQTWWGEWPVSSR